MYCQFEALDARKPWRLRCTQCGKETPPLSIAPESLRRRCPSTSGNPAPPREQPPKKLGEIEPEPPGAGPGSELLKLTAELGISHPPGCSCRKVAKWMDKLGSQGCWDHFPEIVAKVRENAAKWRWSTALANTATAGWRSILSGVAFQINPLDPIPGLVEIAIRRFEQEEQKTNSKEAPVTQEVSTQPQPQQQPQAQAAPAKAVPERSITPTSNPLCIYLGVPDGKSEHGYDKHKCQLYGQCILTGSESGLQTCHGCKDKLLLGQPDFADKWVDPLTIYDRRGKQTDALRDMLAGRSVFLAGGGPSANDLPLESLNRRGAWTLCINNMAGHNRFRPQAMVCTDPPEKFHDSVWEDPQIHKFIPTPKLIDPGRGKLRTKLPDGSFAPLMIGDRQKTTQDCPSVYGVKRRDWIAIDDSFFMDDAAPNGQYKKGQAKSNEPRTICTMMFAMRVLRYLGARKIFLIGVDFHMDPSKGPTENYSFGENRDEGACASNNNQYMIVNDWLCRLQQRGTFAKFGLEIYNLNQRSGLRAFPWVPFEKALEIVTHGVEASPSLAGWYFKPPKEKRRRR